MEHSMEKFTKEFEILGHKHMQEELSSLQFAFLKW